MNLRETRSHLVILRATVAILTIALLALWITTSQPNITNVNNEKPPNLVRTTAQEVNQAYFSKGLAAQLEFDGKMIEVKGIVQEADVSQSTIMLHTVTGAPPLHLVMRGNEEAAAALNGMLVIARCDQIRRVAGTLMLRSCRLQ